MERVADALRAAMPTVDWAALDQKDAEMLANANLGPTLGARILFYALIGILVALAVAGYVFYRGGR